MSTGAIREHEAALAANPAMAQAHVNLISLYGRQGDWEQRRGPLPCGRPPRLRRAGSAVQLRRAPAAAGSRCRSHGCVSAGDRGEPRKCGGLEQPRPAGRARRSARRGARARTGTRCSRRPGDPTMRFNLARMLIAAKHYAEAIRSSRHSRPRDAGAPRYIFGLATAWVHAGDLGRPEARANEARDAGGQTGAAGSRRRHRSRAGEAGRLPQ